MKFLLLNTMQILLKSTLWQQKHAERFKQHAEAMNYYQRAQMYALQ